MGVAEDKAELLDLLFEATNDGVVDWDLLANEARYNDRWRYLLGWDDGVFATTANTWLELVHEEDRGSVEQNLRDHLEQGWPFVQNVRMRHGGLGWRWILMRGASRRNADGHPIRMVIIFADNDERIRAERQVQALVEAMPDTMFRVRTDGTLLAVKHGKASQASVLGELQEQQQLFGALQEAETGAKLAASIQSAGIKGEVDIIPCRLHGAAGKISHLEIRVIRSGDDERVCIVRDITREKTIEQQLARNKEMEAIGHLAAGLAHEINTPLQYIGDNLHFVKDLVPELLELIVGYQAVLAKGPGATAEDLARLAQAEATLDLDFSREALGSVIGNAMAGMAQIEKIVRAMKMFENVEKQVRTLVDLNALVENATVIATSTWSQVAELSIRLAPHLPFVPCLAGEITQVIINLVTNAAQAIDAKRGPKSGKGHIVVETDRDPHAGWVSLRISDDGEGIPDSIRAKIFDPFFSTRPVGQGTGQGLAQVQAAVLGLHGGTVDFTSEVGKGTTFIVRLPITAFEPKPGIDPQTPHNETTATAESVGRIDT
jgi:signal transduction histidine kinase